MNTLNETELSEITGGDFQPLNQPPGYGLQPPVPTFGWGDTGIAGGRNGQPRQVSS